MSWMSNILQILSLDINLKKNLYVEQLKKSQFWPT